MKYINLLCTSPELHCLFPVAELFDLNTITPELSILKIKSNDDMITINHHLDINIYTKIQNTKNNIDINSYYANPIENLTIICDRKLWYEFYYPLLKNDIESFYILEKRYVEKNVTVLFNFAFLEAVNYEDESDLFLYDFKFNHIKLTDYQLFENKNNFYYDSFYSLYHILGEGQLTSILFPNTKYGYYEYLIHFEDIFKNFNVNNRMYRPFVYSQTCQKPRYHRIKFLLEAAKNNILQEGKNNVNIKFLEEYKQCTNENQIHTDNTKKHGLNHKKYFNKDFFDEFLKILNKINITKDDADFLYDHLKYYFKDQEYNDSYIDVVGETHCIFDLQYGFFTEKSIKPIIAENFCMIYGSKKVYEEYKRIGIDLFLDEFELNGIEDKNELEQIDMIVTSLKKLNKSKLQKIYIKNYNKIKDNKKKLFNHYCNIMNDVNKLLLKTNNII